MAFFQLKLFIALLALVFLPLLLNQAWAGSRKIVFAYSAEWMDGLYPPEAYPYESLTHVARSFLRPDQDGHIPVPENYFNPVLTQRAKAHGVKLIASLGGASMKASTWMEITKVPSRKERLFNELEKLIEDHGYDGVDIDWEEGAQTDAERIAYTSFMRALRARFPRWILTTAVMSGDKWARHIEWKVISQSVDYINLMTYDFSGTWSEYAYHHANLYSVPGSKAEDGISTDEVVRRLEKKYGLKPGQALLGIPFYGKLFPVAAWNDPVPAGWPKISGLRYTDTVYLERAGLFHEQWDKSAQAPYLQSASGTGLVTYDNPRSVELKCDYVKSHGLAGIIIWVLGSDLVGNRTPLMEQVGRSFGTDCPEIPAEALEKIDLNLTRAAQSAWSELGDYAKQLAQKGHTELLEELKSHCLPEEPLSPAERLGHIQQLQAFLTDAHPKIREARHQLGLAPAE